MARCGIDSFDVAEEIDDREVATVLARVGVRFQPASDGRGYAARERGYRDGGAPWLAARARCAGAILRR